MIKKQALSLLFSLLFSSVLFSSATTETQACKLVSSKPVRILKSTASLMGYSGLTVCSGIGCYVCGAIASDKFNPLGIIGLVPSCYGLWGGAKGMLSSIKEISRACQSTQACGTACSSDNPVTA